jgi:NDP-sugar pyrophosphorylase family protein
MLKLESELFPRLAEEGKLSGYSFGGNWYDVSSAEVYQHVLKHWQL